MNARLPVPTLLILGALVLATSASAQTRRACGTDTPSAAEVARVQGEIQNYRQRFGASHVGGQIKVAWHVIYSGTTGNIPQSQIDAQILELNRAYSGFYGGANTGYTFVLSSVSRTNNATWFGMTPGSSAERNAKRSLAVNPKTRLNIYSTNGGGYLGWAYFPNSYPEKNTMHGVVIEYGSVPGGYNAPYNLGGTADHEVGHYLGLYHTFQGGCSAPGDYVADTPDEATPTAGCPAGKNTCATAGNDPIHNYMDYSDDACYTEFTAGQDERMDTMVPSYKPSLLNAARVAAAEDLEPELEPAIGVTGAVEFRGPAPNPFADETFVTLYLPKAQSVSLKVYSVTGQLVETLADGELPAGERRFSFRSKGLEPGMYFAALRSGTQTTVRRIVLVP